MFLDPDPKRQKNSMSGFFSSQRPIESPREHRTTVKRKALPLHERSQSQVNEQNPGSSPEKPTVRLVKVSPSLSAQSNSDGDENTSDKKENRHGEEVVRLWTSSAYNVKPASASKPGLSGFASSSQDKFVSDSHTSTNEAQTINPAANDSLLSTTPAHAPLRTEWHRRIASSGNLSISSTLKGSESVFGQQSERSESRFSEGTTLRGTPTLYEQDHRERIDTEAARQGFTHALEPLQEASPERSTVRVVPPSVESESSGNLLQLEPSESLTSSAQSDSDPRPGIQRRSSRRPSSASSGFPAPHNISTFSASPAPRYHTSQESIAQSEATLPQSSSPNFVAYAPDPLRPRSSSHPLYSSASIESIQSRLQYPSIGRPDTGRSLATSSSWASLQPDSSTDTLAPLQVPKKRLRHKPASLSLNSTANLSFASESRMADEDIDTLPYPRQVFSSHLSTIASESDQNSRSTSQHLSHFSLGSGVLTGDDSSSIPLSGTWPRRRRESGNIDSIASEPSPVAPGTSSEEELGDMTLGVFREESAKPQPLFKPRSGSTPGADRRYDGQVPPIPPIPKNRESVEVLDKVSELHTPRLREQRSGYSLRRRSNSTPSRSHSRHMSLASRSEDERWSHGSSIFPTWAKHFYGHGATLMSASKVSLGTNSTPQRQGQHGRNDSQWTERSITSRLGTGYSEIENASPTSSHFLPSIFRPRTRGRANTEGNGRSSKLRKSKRSRASGEESSRPDSMAIFNEPLPQSRNGKTLPSDKPKYGTLKDSSEQRPLPRKYSKQKQWNDMQFPRPMTKDRLSDFGMQIQDPHLGPAKRTSNRLSAWRAPSFVESLDSLVRSRCNRQILLFALGFMCPLLWMVAAVLPLPRKPISANDLEKSLGGSEDDIQAVMTQHEAGDAEKRWREERVWMKARWWRYLNRIMSVIGILVIGAVVSTYAFALMMKASADSTHRLRLRLLRRADFHL